MRQGFSTQWWGISTLSSSILVIHILNHIWGDHTLDEIAVTFWMSVMLAGDLHPVRQESQIPSEEQGGKALS